LALCLKRYPTLRESVHNSSCGKRCEWPFGVLQFTQGSGIASAGDV